MTTIPRTIPNNIQRRVFVSGRVQGVGFRQSVTTRAEAHPGLKGWVRNLPDGRVEAVFQGDERSVLGMVAWCQHGPQFAQVIELEVHEESPDSALMAFGRK